MKQVTNHMFIAHISTLSLPTPPLRALSRIPDDTHANTPVNVHTHQRICTHRAARAFTPTHGVSVQDSA